MLRTRMCVAMFVALVLISAAECRAVAAAAPAGPAASPEGFASQVLPLLQKYCYDCHSGAKPDGTLRLDEFRSAAAVESHRDAWEHVLKMLRGREMPPPEAEHPPEAELEGVVKWIDAALDDIDSRAPPSPGRVTIRRLNRSEYQNTIRDLLGIEFNAAAEFPADDVGYGFDNIGDVLSLPPMLMEKYLAAAEQIAGRAIVTDPIQAAPRTQVDGGRLRTGTGAAPPRDGVATLASQGELYLDHEFPRDGKYILRTQAAADQAGDEPARMRLSLDGQPLNQFDVTARRDQPQDYDWQQQVSPGKHRVALAFTNDFYDPAAADPDRRDRNLHVVNLQLIGPIAAGPEAYPASHRKILFVQPGPGVSPQEATRRILERLASQAFRRPVTGKQLDRIVGLAAARQAEGASLEQSVQSALVGILVSPHFLFRFEQDPEPNTPENVRLLDEYELATRLSYFLWSSMPDDELFAAAAAGELRKNLAAQVRRMLADPKAAMLVDNFALQWLELRSLADFLPDRVQFPTFDDPLREAMVTETRMFCRHILLADRNLLELVDADYTFVNEALARHYGIAGVSGPEFRRVSLAGTPRGGVITLASVLAVTSNPTRTSPVKRGKWVLETILGAPPPAPPANVPQLSEDRRAALTASLRERLEEHRRNPDCAVCHRKMDALGFALENFDAVGAWRTHDGKFPIDPAGELPDGRKLDGPAELKRIVRTTSRDEFVKCLTEKTLIYALGRGLERADRGTVDKIIAKLAGADFRFSALVLEIVHSDPFQKRCGKGSES